MRKSLLPFLILITLLVPLAACDKSKGIKAIEPNFGNVSGNDTVVIVGSGFKPGMTVHFGMHEAKNVVIDSATRIKVKIPSGPEGKVSVIVTSEDGKSMGIKDGFEYRRE